VIRIPALSIFARTFLMMLCALLLSLAVGVAVLASQPHRPTFTAGIFDVVSALRPDLPFPGAGPGGRDMDHGPGQGFPGGGMGPPRFDDLPFEVLRVQVQDAPPQASRDVDARASDMLSRRLASMLDVPVDHVRFFPRGMDTWQGQRGRLGPGTVAALRQDDGHWRVVEVPEGPGGELLARQTLWVLLLGALVLLPLAWLFARALSAPIRRFADAAQRLGTDHAAPALPREGPPEMRQAADAFNTMQARIHRLLHERTHMIAAIAHDLRTPLTRLSFRLEGLPEPAASRVDADIHEMKTMISAALDFIRDRSTGLQRQPLDFRLLVESVADDMVDVGHDVVLAEGPAITLDGDPVALRRAVVNLVDNGLKYGDRVRMRLDEREQTCLLEIDDDGPGIPEVMQRQVFEPFFRLEASRNRDTGGIGLGLATVQAVIAEHGGTVSLRNRKEGGLRVRITVPSRGKA
jgi:two-component system OmpR family sensor kinase